MKKLFLQFAALCIACFVQAQTVENITVEPNEDKINVSYRIGASTDAQLYNVILTCSMDGGQRFEPKSVIGDVGQNIRGGRPYYTIVWDVFKDVDEVGDAEFFVKVELISDMTPTRSQTQPQNQTQLQPRNEPEQAVQQQNPGLPDQGAVGSQKQAISWRSYLAYTGSTDSPIGISFGTLKNFGVYGSIRYGSFTDTYTNAWLTMAAGLTKYIFEAGIYRLHGYGGIGTNVTVFDIGSTTTESFTDNYLVIDFGIINLISKLSLTLGLEVVRDIGAYPVFGIGIAF